MSDSHPAMNASRERGAWSTSGYLMFAIFLGLVAITVLRVSSFAMAPEQFSEALWHMSGGRLLFADRIGDA